ncbi:MAG: branched-chain amino acid aminotransferase, partial [Bacteroidetes bacterium]
EAHAAGKLTEAFGTGTAAVISPIGELNWDGNIISLTDGKTGELSVRLYEMITGIQNGVINDEFNWLTEVK